MGSLKFLDATKALTGDFTEDDLLEPPDDFHIAMPKSGLVKGLNVLGDAFELEGTVPAVKRLINDPSFEDKEGYDPFAETDERLSPFINDLGVIKSIGSPEEFEFRRNRRLHEQDLRENIANAGGGGVAAMIAAGVIDPVNLIGAGGAVVTGTRLARTVGSAAKIGGAIGGIEVGREALLHATSETRTLEESAINVGAATILGGLLGAAGGTISRDAFADMAEQIATKSQKIAEVELQRTNSPTTPMRVEDVRIKAGFENVLEHRLSVDGEPEDLFFEPEIIDNSKATFGGGDQPFESNVALERERGDGWNTETLHALGGKVVELAARLVPEGRLFNSASVHAQRVMMHMIDNDLTRMGNVEGIASPVSVESRVLLWRSRAAEVLQTWETQYRAYQKRVGPGNSVFRGIDEFNVAISRASRRGDVSDILEVSKAAKASRKLYNDLFDEGVRLGQFAEDARVPKGAVSYLTRQWDVKRVVAREREFKERLFNDLRTKNHDISDGDLKDAIDDVFDTIRGAPDATVSFDVVPKAGAFKGRVIDINDVDFEDFLENDATILLNQYVSRVGSRIETVKKFGSVNLSDDIKIIREEYRLAREAASSKAEIDKLIALEKRDINVIRMSRNRVMGVSNSYTPQGARATLAAARKYQVVTKLGAMLLSALLDPLSVVLRHGLGRTTGGLLKWVTQDGELRNLSKTKIKKLGIAADISSNDRLMSFAALSDDFHPRDRVNRTLDNIIQGGEFKGKKIPGFTAITGMPWWNNFWKTFDGALISDKMISDIDKLVKGQRISKNGRTVLAQLGIDDTMAKRIDVQMKQYGEFDDGFAIPEVAAWDDIEAAELFSAAVRKHTDATIFTPNAGNQPFIMDDDVVKTLAQFKSFIFASHNQLLLAGFQQREAGWISLMVAFGALSSLKFAADSLVKGKDFPTDPRDFVLDALGYSGLASVGMELNDTLERFSGNTLGLRPATGAGPGRRFSPRSAAEIVGGPTFGAIGDMLMLTTDLLNGSFKEKHLRVGAKNTPFNNTVFTYRIRDAGIEDTADALGIEQK